MPMKSVETSTPRPILALGAAETSYGGHVFAASSSSSRAGALFARKGARNAESVENKHSENVDVDVVESSLGFARRGLASVVYSARHFRGDPA